VPSICSQELARIEPRYFVELPGPVAGPGGFALPSQGPNPDRQLLRMLFDLIRNGQAHQYRQINVDLTDGKELQVWLSGVTPGLVIESHVTSPFPRLIATTAPRHRRSAER
jgi:hypothetical protein